MTPSQSALVERLRAMLATEPALREVSMFGGRSFMVNEKLVVTDGPAATWLSVSRPPRRDAMPDRYTRPSWP